MNQLVDAFLQSNTKHSFSLTADILQLSEKEYEEEKLSETLLLSVAAVAQHYMRLPNSNPKV